MVRSKLKFSLLLITGFALVTACGNDDDNTDKTGQASNDDSDPNDDNADDDNADDGDADDSDTDDGDTDDDNADDGDTDDGDTDDGDTDDGDTDDGDTDDGDTDDGDTDDGDTDDGADDGDTDDGDTDEDEPNADGETTGGSEYLTCEALSLDEQGNVLTSECRVHDSGEVACYCGVAAGQDVEATPIDGSGASTCDEALELACEISELDRMTCAEEDYGACAPLDDAGETWRCACQGADELSTLDAGSCREAAFVACAQGCESGADYCAPGSEALTYECGCELYGPRTVSWDGYGCAELLENTCEPGHGLHQWGSCTSETGYCDQPDPGEPTWTCECLDGSSDTVTLEFDEGAGDGEGVEPDCGVALLEVCGEYEPPAGDTCERSTEAGSARCQRDPSGDPDAPEGELSFTCGCSWSCGDGAGASGGGQFATSCEAAMDQACGVDGPSCD